MRVTWTEWLIETLVRVIVSGNVPFCCLSPTTKIRYEVPDRVIVGGTNVPATFDGKPATVSFACPENLIFVSTVVGSTFAIASES